MKPKTIIGIVVMIGFTALLFLNFGQQVGGYMNFARAADTGSRAHVIGEWVESRGYDYNPDQNLFTFYMRDGEGNVRRVVYQNPKPANFEQAEELVVEGSVQDDVFLAEHILVKCPSKYNDARTRFEQTGSEASGHPDSIPLNEGVEAPEDTAQVDASSDTAQR